MTRRSGPFEDVPWPTRLRAQVVDPRGAPRVQGYALEADLSAHYGLAEIMRLALVGELASEVMGRAFEVALAFASACPINEAPTHAAVLARTLGAPASSALAAGLVVASDAARFMVAEHRELLAWLDAEGRREELPARARASARRDVEAVAELAQILAALGPGAPQPPAGASRDAAVLAVLWRCGLQTEDQLVVALTWARTIAVGAEAIAARRGAMGRYTARTPDFRYEVAGEAGEP